MQGVKSLFKQLHLHSNNHPIIITAQNLVGNQVLSSNLLLSLSRKSKTQSFRKPETRLSVSRHDLHEICTLLAVQT